MSKQRMAGDKIDLSHIQNLPKGLDPELVKQAHRGQGWGEQDQRRYDKLAGTHIGQKAARDMTDGGLRQDYAALQAKKESGATFSDRANRIMERKGERIANQDARRAAKERANGPHLHKQPVQPPQQGQIPPGTQVDQSVDNSFGVGGDLEQNVGKKGDTNTTIGDNNQIGHGATIGGDYSVTIGGNTAGNGQQGSGTGNVFNNMSNLELSTSYNALNENAYHRSSAQLNGAGRAAQASAAANEITGATDRVANLYNATGADQNYWRNKANAQSNFYLGDIFKKGFGGYDYTMPDAPNKIEDNTESIYGDAKKEMKDV